MYLAVAETLFRALDVGQSRVRFGFLLKDTLLDLRDLNPAILDLRLDPAAELNRLLARIDLRLAADRLGFAPGVRKESTPLCLSCSNPRARPAEEEHGCREGSDQNSDERHDSREHAGLRGGFLCPRLRRGAHTRQSACSAATGVCPRPLLQVVAHPPLSARFRPVGLIIEG